MLNSGLLLKAALLAIVLVAVVESGPMQKLSDCCTTANKLEIKEPIKGFRIQEAQPPCVNAVIFETESGRYCSHGNARWVRNKIRELRKSKAK